jgi:ApbE superfamily uncharacterized protein (UPF0280 family)
MAAVSGAVADHVLEAMLEGRDLDRAYVNDGGDIAFHLSPRERLTFGLVTDLRQPRLDGRLVVRFEDQVRGIATSGWPGRSFSLGIADAVTVLAGSAAAADAAATMIANAVDLDPGHPAVQRRRADTLDPDTDLGSLPVTIGVAELDSAAIAQALGNGAATAARLHRLGTIIEAGMWLQGRFRRIGGAHPDAMPASAAWRS